MPDSLVMHLKTVSKESENEFSRVQVGVGQLFYHLSQIRGPWREDLGFKLIVNGTLGIR